MKLIVGLGNPGNEYDCTRHNVGFQFLDYYLKSQKISDLNWIKKFDGLYLQINLLGEKVIFLKPQSYMNLSGGVVRKYLDFFKIPINDILVISDDLDLSLGNFKLKEKGSSGGHNGLKDIERNLNTQEYKRLKIGISKNKMYDTKDYVLGKMSKEETKILENCYDSLINVVNDYIVVDFHNLMNKYNRKNR